MEEEGRDIYCFTVLTYGSRLTQQLQYDIALTVRPQHADTAPDEKTTALAMPSVMHGLQHQFSCDTALAARPQYAGTAPDENTTALAMPACWEVPVPGSGLSPNKF